MKHKFVNKKTGAEARVIAMCLDSDGVMQVDGYDTVEDLMGDYAAYEEYNPPKEPLIKDEKIRRAVRTWAEAENCTNEMNLYYTLNRQEKYITFHNPQTGSELQLCDFDLPVFQEMREYSIAELCGEVEE